MLSNHDANKKYPAMDDLKAAKKNIKLDWLGAFPNLRAHSQNKFYKILGPTIIGIELINLPNQPAYRPHLVCYPLWKENLKACLDGSFMLMEFENHRRMQFSIPYLKHKDHFQAVLSSIDSQSILK